VRVAAATQAVAEEAAIVSKSASLEQLQAFAGRGFLYALLDACDEPAVPKRCAELTEARAVSLYRGDKAVEYAHLAPYLAQLDESDIEWIQTKLWMAPWGYFVIARSDLATLRSHFRRYLTVKLPDNSKVLFRFYDPRVVKTFLGASDPPTIRQFFGPAQGFAITSAADLTSVELLTSAA
jgi:hypothetical protein